MTSVAIAASADAADNAKPATERTPLLSEPASLTTSPTLRPQSDGSFTSSRELDTSEPDTATGDDDDGPNHVIGPFRAVGVTLSLWLFIFTQATNLSGMTMLQGSIAEDLNCHEQVLWLTTSFLIPTSSFSPVAGRLAGIFHPQALVPPIALLLAVGSFICAVANSFEMFIVGRVIAGMGAAGVLTLSIITVLELTSKKKRGLFIGLVNTGMTIGVSFGAVVYGALNPVIGWRPLFWAQAPIVLIAGVALYASLPKTMKQKNEDKTSSWEKAKRIDYAGAGLLTLTIVLFLYGLAGEISYLFLGLSLVSLIIFVVFEFRVPSDPIIPLQVLSSRGALLSCLAQVGLMSARWTILFFTPIFMLAVHGAAPAQAGSILIPTNVGFGLGGLVIGWVHIRRSGSFWLPSLISLSLIGVTLYMLSRVATPDHSVETFVAVVFISGFATGAFLNYTLAHIIHLSPKNTEYVTTSLMGTFRGFGGSFGTSLGGGVFYRILRASLASGFSDLDGTDDLDPARRQLISRLMGSPSLVFHGNLKPDETAVALQGYTSASQGVWLAAAILALSMLFVQAGTGWTAPKGKEEEESLTQARAVVAESEGIEEV